MFFFLFDFKLLGQCLELVVCKITKFYDMVQTIFFSENDIERQNKSKSTILVGFCYILDHLLVSMVYF